MVLLIDFLANSNGLTDIFDLFNRMVILVSLALSSFVLLVTKKYREVIRKN